MRFVVCIIMSMVVFASWPGESLATDGVNEENKGKRPMISTRLFLEQTERADIDGTDTSIGYTEFSAGLEWQFILFDIDHREYHWRNSASFGVDPGLYPWETLTRIAPGLQYYSELFNKWGLWFKFVAISGFEDDISLQSWTYNPQVLGFYRYTQRIALYSGIGILYHPVESDPYPVFGIYWNMESKDGFSGAVGFPATRVRYGFNEKVALKINYEFDIRTYHLAQNNVLAPEGYVRIEDLKPSIHVEWNLLEELTLSLGIRLYVSRSMTVFDHEKDELTSHDVSSSWAYLLGIDYRF